MLENIWSIFIKYLGGLLFVIFSFIGEVIFLCSENRELYIAFMLAFLLGILIG